MDTKPDYIRWIRGKVGHEPIILNFAGGIICNEQDEVLLQRRGDTNTWGFPGGALELGESADEAAVREILEETGLTVRTERLIGVYTKYFNRYPNGDAAQTIAFFFECNVTGGELTVDGGETLELKFFPKNSLPPLFVKQHQDAYEDWLGGRYGAYR
ncbi:NUDIX hydrolase [Paenibacillus tepidiphilus]|uniref:NUDIX hydrolase n=1 Tax=Paenibacillus tepidiphilus TaxID=2608683 RepID=UPI00123C7822|nr:NUDIX hydrolase [Paenibacillus tepidiphilus]